MLLPGPSLSPLGVSRRRRASGVGNSASFLASDSATGGSWVGVYGADGYVIAQSGAGPEGASLYKSLPSYASFGSTTGSAQFSWAASTSDTRALQYPGATGRIASTWYTPVNATPEVFDLTLTAAKTVRLYLLDWDSANREERIIINDGDTGTTLYTGPDIGNPTHFNGGIWQSFTISGHVKISVGSLGGVNAVVSGFFFDP